MGPRDVVGAVAMVVLWTMVVYRVGLLRQPGSPRRLWFALLSLAGALTIRFEPTYAAVEAAWGAPRAAVVKQTFSFAAAAAVLLLVSALTGTQRSWRRLLAVTTVAATAACAPLLLGRGADMPRDLQPQAEYYTSSWPWAVHWAAVLLFLSWGLASTARMCAQYSRLAPPGPLRLGLRMIVAGITLIFVELTLKAAVLVAGYLDLGRVLAATDRAPVEVFLINTGIGLIAVGSVFEALARRWGALRGYLAMRRSLRRLHPLWKAVVTAAPHVALDSRGPVGALLSATFNTRVRLYRYVVEIRDGLLSLSPYVLPSLRSDVLEAAGAAGKRGDDAVVVAEAVWLRVALAAKDRGQAPARAAVEEHVPGGSDLSEEVRWLERVAAAYRRCPLVERLSGDHVSSAVPVRKAA